MPLHVRPLDGDDEGNAEESADFRSSTRLAASRREPVANAILARGIGLRAPVSRPPAPRAAVARYRDCGVARLLGMDARSVLGRGEHRRLAEQFERTTSTSTSTGPARGEDGDFDWVAAIAVDALIPRIEAQRRHP